MFFCTLRTSLDHGEPPVDFCQTPSGISTIAGSQGSSTTGRELISLPAQGDWSIRDESARSLGWVNGQFISEIPDAYALPESLGDAAISQRALYLPTGTYTVEVSNSPSQAVITSIFGDGRLIEANGNLFSSNSSFELQAAQDLEQAVVSDTQNLDSFALGFVNESSALSRLASVSGYAISGTDKLDARFDGEKVTLSRAGGTLQYSVRLEQAGTQSGSFLSPPVFLGVNEAHVLTPIVWSGLNSSELVLQIDRGRDGTIDETVMLENQMLYIYLPLIVHNH